MEMLRDSDRRKEIQETVNKAIALMKDKYFHKQSALEILFGQSLAWYIVADYLLGSESSSEVVRKELPQLCHQAQILGCFSGDSHPMIRDGFDAGVKAILTGRTSDAIVNIFDNIHNIKDIDT